MTTAITSKQVVVTVIAIRRSKESSPSSTMNDDSAHNGGMIGKAVPPKSVLVEMPEDDADALDHVGKGECTMHVVDVTTSMSQAHANNTAQLHCCNRHERHIAPTPAAGTWYHAGYHIATTIATPAAFAPLPWAFSRLGWTGGVISLVAATLVTYYNSMLLASLHHLGGKRNIRYRELGRKVYGEGPLPAWKLRKSMTARLVFWPMILYNLTHSALMHTNKACLSA